MLVSFYASIRGLNNAEPFVVTSKAARPVLDDDGVLFYSSGYQERPLGQPGALQPAAGVHQHLRQLVWLHASGPLPVPPGPSALQRPSVRPAQEVQRPGEGVTTKPDRKWAFFLKAARWTHR